MSESGYKTSRTNHGSADPAGPDIPPELAAVRQTTDNIGAALIHTLAEYFRCTQRIGHIKALNELPPADLAREARQAARLRVLVEQSGLDPDFVQKSLVFMITEVIRHHEDIKAEYENGE